MSKLTERYADKIRGVLSCFDRVVITGTMVFRSSALPRMSVMGRDSSAATQAASSINARFGDFPRNTASAPRTLIGVGATALSTILMSSMMPGVTGSPGRPPRAASSA